MGRLDEQPARMGLALARDVTRASRPLARLADLRIEPEIADQVARRGKAGDLPDHAEDRERGDRSDTGDGHEPPHGLALQRVPGQGALEALHFPLEGVVQAQGRGELL